MNKIVQYAMMFLFALASVFPLYSAFTMTSSVISNGGMINSGDGNSVTLSATVGESVIGDSENSAGDVQLFSGFWHTCLSEGASDIGAEEILPYKYDLSQNYPNPFNPTTTINYELQNDNIVNLAIYNVKGELVKNIVNNRTMREGKHSISFDGAGLSSGYYFYRIAIGMNGKDFSRIKKMIMVK